MNSVDEGTRVQLSLEKKLGKPPGDDGNGGLWLDALAARQMLNAFSCSELARALAGVIWQLLIGDETL